jgi:hypothetical protein
MQKLVVMAGAKLQNSNLKEDNMEAWKQITKLQP